MSSPAFRIGQLVKYEGDSANLNGKVGEIKRVRRDELNSTTWNYSVKFQRGTWKVHERNLVAVDSFGDKDLLQHQRLHIAEHGHGKTLVLNKVDTGRWGAGDNRVERAQPVIAGVNDTRLEPPQPRFIQGGPLETAGPEPLPIKRGSRVEITSGPMLGEKGEVLRLWSGSSGRLMFDVTLDCPPKGWIGNRASFSANLLAPIADKKKEEPRGLWQDGKKVKVLDFTKILKPKGEMYGPVDGMIMANALDKQRP